MGAVPVRDPLHPARGSGRTKRESAKDGGFCGKGGRWPPFFFLVIYAELLTAPGTRACSCFPSNHQHLPAHLSFH